MVKLNSFGRFLRRHGNCLREYAIQVAEDKRIYPDKETQLMIKALEGDERAYDQLYRKYFPVVTSFITSLNGNFHSSEDLSQKVFTLIWEKRIKFRGDSSVKTYLLAVARNVLSEYRRQGDKESAVKQTWLLKQKDPSVSSESHCELYDAESIENIRRAKGYLTAEQLQAIELIYNIGLPSIMAAKIANCTEKALECRLWRAHKKLHQVMRNLGRKNICKDISRNFFL